MRHGPSECRLRGTQSKRDAWPGFHAIHDEQSHTFCQLPWGFIVAVVSAWKNPYFCTANIQLTAEFAAATRTLSVGTVDSSQGQERDIIAITLTRSNPQGEICFLSDIRRMNVGMTRERDKLLLVGDSSMLCNHPSTGYTFVLDASLQQGDSRSR